MKARFVKDMPASHPEDWPPDGIIPEGTVIEKDDIWILVRHGVAEPADEECRIAAGMTDPEIKIAKMRQRRKSAGISYEDYDAYDQGLMVGYNADGSWKPGPNAASDRPDDDDEYDDEPDDEPDYEEDEDDE